MFTSYRLLYLVNYNKIRDSAVFFFSSAAAILTFFLGFRLVARRSWPQTPNMAGRTYLLSRPGMVVYCLLLLNSCSVRMVGDIVVVCRTGDL